MGALAVLLVALVLGGDPELAFWRGLALAFQVYHQSYTLYHYLVNGVTRHLCHSDSPWQLWAWEKAEAVLAQRAPVPSVPVPVIELPQHLQRPEAKWEDRERYVCTQIFQHFGGWGNKPFVIQGLLVGTDILGDGDAWTLDWLAKHAGEQMIHSVNLSVYRDNWAEIRRCPFKRFFAKETQTVTETVRGMGVNSDLYVNFAETLFGDVDFLDHSANPSTYLRQMAAADRLWSLCAAQDMPGHSFAGYSGEVFFGASEGGEEVHPVGTPMHAAYMRNLFLQARGKRLWYLWHPSNIQFVRPSTAVGYLTAFAAHASWNLSAAPTGPGLEATFARHVHAMPSLTADMSPGDLLYIPPWWLHAIHVHSGYSLGISARGQDWPGGSVLQAPALRFLRDWSSLDAVMLDLFSVLPGVVGDTLAGRRNGIVEQRQHGAMQR